MEFVGFPKIGRLFRDIVITEKIDGTNGQVVIEQVEDSIAYETEKGVPLMYVLVGEGKYAIWAASRTRYITPDKDNHGFAKWVFDNAFELVAKLGPGRHFGEWWGQGIQRNYGLKEKRFSLFNVAKWGDPAVRPACCHVVPVIYTGPMGTDLVKGALKHLAEHGSYASPGYPNPEGVVVYHTAANVCFKATIEGDEKPKGVVVEV